MLMLDLQTVSLHGTEFSAILSTFLSDSLISTKNSSRYRIIFHWLKHEKEIAIPRRDNKTTIKSTDRKVLIKYSLKSNLIDLKLFMNHLIA